MDKPIVAVVQNKLLVAKTTDELQTYFRRFLRIAKTKDCKLVVMPEYTGLAVGIPMFSGWRNALLKEASAPKKGILPKLKSILAGGAANVVRADLQKALRMTLSQMPESLHDAYTDMFSTLARDYEITLIPGSFYDYDAMTGAIYNTAYVFGPDGGLLGKQSQVVLDANGLDVVTPADGWQAIDTPVGRVGILFGQEALYPEPARVLAYQGSDMLITLAATKRPATYAKIRQSTLARCQENQLYGIVSFLVGADPFISTDGSVFMGRSAILAPLDFTPRFTGVMVELGSPQAEGVVTAEWDYPALHELWQTSETPIRREMPLAQTALLSQIYGRALALGDSGQTHLESIESPSEMAQPTLPLLDRQSEESQEKSVNEKEEDDFVSLVAPILPSELTAIPLEEPETDASAQEEDAASLSAADADVPVPDSEIESEADESKTA